jgi:cytochrome c oxidase cbb3-type subunit I/II
MLNAIDESGRLAYPDFVETVIRIVPLYWIRAFGGTLFLAGFLVMCWNLWKTYSNAPKNQPEDVFKAPALKQEKSKAEPAHRALEGMASVFTILAVIAIVIGSVLEILPTMMAHNFVKPNEAVLPYTALEQAGRDIYVKEGCYTCHSQMIRTMPSEVLRYGPASQPQDSMWDRPFQWGSKRTGPDLARVGSKYPDLWHYRHMLDPRSMTPNSLMPSYPWLFTYKTDFEGLSRKLQVMKSLGVPYTDEEVAQANENARAEAKKIAEGLSNDVPVKNLEERQIIALIAYLQRLGKNGGKQ